MIREFPTLRQQQELNWAALQSFRTLSGRVLEDLQKQQGARQQSEVTSGQQPAGSGAGEESSGERPISTATNDADLCNPPVLPYPGTAPSSKL